MAQFDEIIDLGKRRGFFFSTAEIYPNTIGGVWDYAPYGVVVKRRLEALWRKIFVHQQRLFEISGGSILPKQVFEASGHLKSFVDPLTQCQKCKNVHRADKLLAEKLEKEIPEGLPVEELNEMLVDHKITCPICGGPVSPVRHFNLMFPLQIGAVGDQTGYLRPETCQNIFVDFNRIQRVMRAKLPFGIAQIGRSFRNEISPRRGLIRLREFTQAEAEIFFDPETLQTFPLPKDISKHILRISPYDKPETETLEITADKAVKDGVIKGSLIAYYMVILQRYFETLEIPKPLFRYRELSESDRPFYAEQAFDFQLLTSWGWQEIVGNHYRTDHDLKSHMAVSKKDLTVFDEEKKAKILPHVWETSLGIDRLLFCLLDIAYNIQKKTGGKDEVRCWLQLAKVITPADVAVFPLVKKDGLREIAQEIEQSLANLDFITIYDEKGAIGRRYARVDEIGVPYALTIDYQTKEDQTVTIRDRDTMAQKRISRGDLDSFFQNLQKGKTNFESLP
ncbi:MAG: glycine--tRNA ligase [Candidatus Ranarchaeia archaeon]